MFYGSLTEKARKMWQTAFSNDAGLRQQGRHICKLLTKRDIIAVVIIKIKPLYETQIECNT